MTFSQALPYPRVSRIQYSHRLDPELDLEAPESSPCSERPRLSHSPRRSIPNHHSKKTEEDKVSMYNSLWVN